MPNPTILLSQCRWPELPEPYDRALKLAVEYILGRFEPLGIVASGTILRGNPSPSSDLDLYVIHAEPRRKRIQKLFGDPPHGSPLPGVPAEIFVNPPNAIDRYLKEEQEDARPLTAHMLATGFVVLDCDPVVDRLRRQAAGMLEHLLPARPAKLTWLRYMAATHYEDAADILPSCPENAALILGGAVTEMLRFPFWQSGLFLPRDKDLFRAIETADSELASLARRFFAEASIEERFQLASQIAARTIRETGFFEWESEFEDI